MRQVSEQHHAFDLFGTQVRVLVAASAPVYARLAIARTQSRLESIHRALTRFDPRSELSRLNAAAGQPVRVSSTMLAAIQAAMSAAAASGGLVDLTLLGALERAGYAESFIGRSPAPLAEALAHAPARRPAGPRADRAWAQILVWERDHLVCLPDGVRVDLGGTAKGMAVDLAARMLAAYPAFAVDAGGDIRTGGLWAIRRPIEIAHPLRDEPAYRFELTSGAVATSGLRTRVWKTVDGYGHHLIDPASGLPAWTGVSQATALAPTAHEAETLAKTALLSGPLAGRAVLERYGGMLILDTGKAIVIGKLANARACQFELRRRSA